MLEIEVCYNDAATIGHAERYVVLVDIVSNISTGGYTFDIGQSGAFSVEDGVDCPGYHLCLS